MPQNDEPLKSVPSRREQFRAALVIVQIGVLLLAIVAQKMQPPPPRDGVVYVNRQVVFAASNDGTWHQGLLPLYADCVLHWTDADGEHQSVPDSMGVPLDTGAWLPENSQVAFSFRAREMSYTPGHPQVTLHLDDADIQLWSECPPPAKEMAVYMENNTLMLVDTETGVVTSLMPLRNDLLWSGTTSTYLTVDAIPGYLDEPDVSWLPKNAELVGTFKSTTPVEVVTLDKHHIMLRTSGEDIVLLSF